MRLLYSLMLFFVSIICFTECAYENNEGYDQENVNVTLDYKFIESGSMSRATGESVYNNFYDQYIKTKQLTPTTYSLTFQNKDTKKEVLSISGTWSEHNSIRLPEGEYIVKGKSQPIERETYYDYEYPSDTVYLTFEEDVKIVRDMSNLVLTAKYDAYLLMFDTYNTEKIMLYNGDYISSNDNIFWLFMRDKKYRTSSGSSTGYYDLTIVRKNNDIIDIKVEDIPFEKGKYYYFNDMTNSFDIPKMESGN